MKKLLLLAPLALFAYNINNTKIFTKKLTPDTLKTSLSVTVRGKTLEDVLNKTNIIIKYSEECQSVNYNFTPNYELKNKKRVFVGYKANIHETCEFKNSKDFSKLLENIKDYGKVSLNSISYVSSKQKQAIKELKLKAYNFALNEAKALSKSLNKSCILKNISFNPYMPKPLRNYRPVKALEVQAIEAPLPKRANTTKVTATYQIECF